PGTDESDARAHAVSLDAIAMARRCGDDDSLMYVLRWSGHAQGFRVPVREHLPIVFESIALAERLGRPLETIEQRTWLVGTRLALGDRAGSDAAREQLLVLLASVPQPHYRWRIPILHAHGALLRGELVEAARWLGSARELAREYQLDRAFTA